jgi:hypothetical protein
MGWPVILTAQSQDDLREIVCFSARDSSNAVYVLRFWHGARGTLEIRNG